MEETRHSSVQEPWVGVGPNASKTLSFTAAEGKTVPSGLCESTGCVRFQSVELCPPGTHYDGSIHLHQEDGSRAEDCRRAM
ncbi:hypothetical protein WJX72_007131 [[Myrmecia] bisecta]|uniref:Uncharacterized protein n=1 Tax=[Myrmecia] bisecta TaxID=41462 RepID=A0AAW1R7P8_9CHLO